MCNSLQGQLSKTFNPNEFLSGFPLLNTATGSKAAPCNAEQHRHDNESSIVRKCGCLTGMHYTTLFSLRQLGRVSPSIGDYYGLRVETAFGGNHLTPLLIPQRPSSSVAIITAIIRLLMMSSSLA
jgi:hypothetical protein